MNAPRHDPEELKRALDTLAEILQKSHEVQLQRDALARTAHTLAEQERLARGDAGKVLRREGGLVVHNGRMWKVDQHGCVSCEDVGVNLDAIEEARKGKVTPLTLVGAAGKVA